MKIHISQYFVVLMVIMPPVHAAETDIDKALMNLFDNRDISEFIELRKNEEIVAGEYSVRQGDSLDVIINKAYGNSLIRRDILRKAFVAKNPGAFRNANPNWLLAGVVLQIPNAEDVQSLLFDDYGKVRERYPHDTSSWVRYP
jgi:Tfp pilus assembly protein FimV